MICSMSQKFYKRNPAEVSAGKQAFERQAKEALFLIVRYKKKIISIIPKGNILPKI